jgi:thiol-disulfide isomerase/thioredoxin
MDLESNIEKLLVESILIESESGKIHFNENISKLIEQKRAMLEDSNREWYEIIIDSGTDERLAQSVLNLSWHNSDFLAYYLSITDYLDINITEDWLPLTAVLAQLNEPKPKSKGSPEKFFPIHGDWLSIFNKLFPNSIVYFWRYNCEPCDIMKEEFNEIFNEVPSDFGLFSVFGPDYSQRLKEEFNVSGGPEILFIINGRVDSRLHGAQYRDVIENEINILKEEVL